LGKSLSDLVRKILTRTSVDPEDVETLVKGLQKILLQSDVDVKLVFDMSENIRRRCLKEEIPTGLTLREHVMKVVYDELVKLLGEKQISLLGKKRIMLLGLFGSGKTTTCGKLARYFQKQGLKPVMICCDYHRPAAPEQLKQIGDKLHIPVYVSEKRDPYDALKEGLSKFGKYDTVIIDTAGRDALDKELAEELKKMDKICQPDEVLLVLPADIGRIGGKQAEEFNKLIGITGIIITKMDGTAKGGGALSACSATSSKVKFIGIGEKTEDFEAYDPVRFVSRLLGMGDLQSLLEKFKDAEFKEEDVEKIMSGKFTLQDFYNQINGMQKMGPLNKVMDMIPGLGYSIPENLLQVQEEKLKKYKYIIDSMTKKERENPDIIHSSRIQRIARGSGTNQKDVRDLLKQYSQSKKMIKQIGGVKGMKRGAMKDLAKKFGIKF
ncbi:MAG: signal recognition particle receptor subunit alpha, partial [Candidatus Aenigmarchaeota archaeon]|nr:signal recognition particle receptor subunit alpha [Candidatus Aenigmarchaeota archaeon]